MNRCGYRRGFTIVELLIVIVVIAVLAAITIVAYNGIQQRANNTAIISAASQLQKLGKMYRTTYNVDTLINGNYCLTVDNICTNYADDKIEQSNDAILAELRKVGFVPSSVPKVSTKGYGITLDTYYQTTINNQPRGIMMYTLAGENQACGISGIVRWEGPPNNYTTANFPHTSSGSGVTRCWAEF